jgi:hypothetical protein
MHPRPIDFIGAALLAAVLIALVVILVAGNLPAPEA